MEPGPSDAYGAAMDTAGYQQQGFPPRRPDTKAERHARIDREEEVIAKADADIDAGLGVGLDEAEVWLNTLDHDPDAPLPVPRGGPAAR